MKRQQLQITELEKKLKEVKDVSNEYELLIDQLTIDLKNTESIIADKTTAITDLEAELKSKAEELQNAVVSKLPTEANDHQEKLLQTLSSEK